MDRGLVIHIPAGVYAVFTNPRLNWNDETEDKCASVRGSRAGPSKSARQSPKRSWKRVSTAAGLCTGARIDEVGKHTQCRELQTVIRFQREAEFVADPP